MSESPVTVNDGSQTNSDTSKGLLKGGGHCVCAEEEAESGRFNVRGAVLLA
jgi:hypothetical protein